MIDTIYQAWAQGYKWVVMDGYLCKIVVSRYWYVKYQDGSYYCVNPTDKITKVVYSKWVQLARARYK